MSTPTHASLRPADRLLHDDLVQARLEGAIHHQDQPRAHLWVLEAREVEPADRGEDDVVEVPLAAAVPLHRIEAELERRDPLRAVGASDRAVHRALDGERGGLDQLRPVVDPVELVEVRHPARVGTVTSASNSQKSFTGSAMPCSCARLQRMSEATEPPRWVCSSASPSPSTMRSGSGFSLSPVLGL